MKIEETTVKLTYLRPVREVKDLYMDIHGAKINGTHVSILHSGLVSLATQAQAHWRKRHDTKAQARSAANVLIVAFYLRF